MMMDPNIELVNVTAISTVLNYNLRFVNLWPPHASRVEVQQAIDEDIKPSGTRAVCTGSEVRKAIRDGATISYTYFYADMTNAGRYQITEADCSKLR